MTLVSSANIMGSDKEHIVEEGHLRILRKAKALEFTLEELYVFHFSI
jgi:hypothetical protein